MMPDPHDPSYTLHPAVVRPCPACDGTGVSGLDLVGWQAKRAASVASIAQAIERELQRGQR